MKTMRRLIGISPAPWAAALLLFAVCSVSAADDTELTVRVMEGKVTDRVTVAAPSPLRVSFSGGAVEGPRVTIAADGSATLSLTLGGKSVRAPAPLTIAPVSDGTILTVTAGDNRHRYRGRLAVSVEKGAIVLINSVPLEEYLLSVVPAELTTTETAALEAQAILCRTFALKNRKRHGGWDLCDLTHCQHYAGVDYRDRLG